MRPYDEIKRDFDASLATLDATLEALRQPLPWFDPDLNSGALMKPTCDEAGHWRYVPAVSIDGPRVPIKIGNRFFRLMPPAAPWCVSEFVEISPDDVARAAVEGGPMGEVA